MSELYPVPRELFPPAPFLSAALEGLLGESDGEAAFQSAMREFFGDHPPSPDSETAPTDLSRFVEWFLFDRTLASGETPFAHYLRSLDAAQRARAAVLEGNRHDAWQVASVAGGRVTFRPLGGGENVVVENPAMAEVLEPNEYMVGRFYPYEGQIIPSVALFHVPDLGPLPPADKAMDALSAQRIFFALDPAIALSPDEAARELAALLERFGMPIDLDGVRELAKGAADPEAFIGAFDEQANAAAGALGSLEEGARLGALLLNVWYHTPRAELGGKTPLEADAAMEGVITTAVDRLFSSLAAEDEAAMRENLDPEGELALVYDLWGWPGLRMLTDWGAPAVGHEILTLEDDMGAMRVELRWSGPHGTRRGGTLWLIETGEGWGVTEALPELAIDDLINPEFRVAEDKGCRLPWRTPAPDPVEERLRAAIAARKLPMLEQATMIKAWRMSAEHARRDMSQPEAWAAAVEVMFRQSLGQSFTPAQAAESYGAKKALVKERYQVLAEVFNQSAG